MVEIYDVTFEHHRENVGIGESAPRISWRLRGDEKNWSQKSYEIEVTHQGLFQEAPQIFSVTSPQSVLVPWPSTPLKSRESAKVRVRVIGVNDVDFSPWCFRVIVEAGLLTSKDWSAKMIAAERQLTTNDSLRPIYFRKSFHLAKDIFSARLYVTSYGIYQVTINRERVGDHVLAPGWTAYKYHLDYQTYDVSGLLKEGDNCIGFEVAEGWYSGRLGFDGGRRCIYGDKLAILAQLEVNYEGGGKQKIVSDETWKTHTSPTISSEIYDGEAYDMNLEISGWSNTLFDDQNWSEVELLDFPTAELRSRDGPPIRVTGIKWAQKYFKSPTNKTIVDFGQNLVGWINVNVQGPKGHKITFTHVEVLENGEIATRPLRACKAQDELILSGEPISWSPKFTFHGFRYVQIDNWPSETGIPEGPDVRARVIHTDMLETGTFTCSDPLLNQLHSNIKQSMRGNFVGIPTDCPQRDERLGWTGDIQVFSPTANYLYDTSGMLSTWLKDLASEQINDLNGIVPVIVPNILPMKFTMPQAAWSDVAIILPWDLYLSFDDKRILEVQYESMKQWLEKGVKRQENSLWIEEGHQLGDWLDPSAPPSEPGNGKTDSHLVANAYLVHVTESMVKISSVLNLIREEEYYEKEARKLKKLFQDEYMTPTGRLAPDTMTSIALAIEFDLFSTPKQRVAAGERLDKLVRNARFRISTGFVGTPIICPALVKVGKIQLALKMLLQKKCPSWLYPVGMGATTIWERWDSLLPDGSVNPGEMTSFNHYALGSIGAFLHSSIAGLSPLSPGWKTILFAPIPGGTITSAKGTFLSPYGMVSCEWKIQNGKFWMEVVVPLNCEGVVRIPGGMEEDVRVGSGRWEFVIEWRGDELGVWPPQAAYDPFAQYEDKDD